MVHDIGPLKKAKQQAEQDPFLAKLVRAGLPCPGNGRIKDIKLRVRQTKFQKARILLVNGMPGTIGPRMPRPSLLLQIKPERQGQSTDNHEMGDNLQKIVHDGNLRS